MIASDRFAERVRREQVAAMYRSGLPLVATLVAGLVLVVLFVRVGGVSLPTAVVWLAYTTIQTAARLCLIAAYRRASPEARRSPLWGRLFTLGAAVAGVGWGVGGLWLMPPGHFDLQLLLFTTISALVYGSQASFGFYLPAFFSFMLPAMVPGMVWALFQGDAGHLVYAVLAALWIPTVGLIALRFSRNATENLVLTFENQDLAENLARQKDRAEQASLDKSRFLASASHDLRQPVHALGLYVGAMRAHHLPPQASELLDHLEASVSALDGLFGSLLDISRLDAGVIEARPQTVALQPLLERVRRDLAEEAIAKGLELTLVPCRLATRSDPILLERIVRNIATNAVRHTERGGVVMGVRRGEALAIEVWDTGPGIAPAQRELVFQEFFQVSNSGRDRAKGLGLGLAIVRRLTGLLGHPLTLESEPGKGSVFRIQVPRVPLIEAAPAKADTRAGEGGLILVVDDEAAIQEAMRALLESWGWRVIAAGGLQEMLARIQGLDCTPDLIISDFRLGGGEDGIAVIHRLRAELDVQVPAMLITGDTAPDRLIEARASGFLLLHKPVPNARLRAAIGNLVARAAAEQGLRRPRTRRRGRR